MERGRFTKYMCSLCGHTTNKEDMKTPPARKRPLPEAWESSSNKRSPVLERSVALALTPSRAIVTPLAKTENSYCLEYRQNRCCHCYKAKFKQDCQSCKSRVNVGDCVHNLGFGWVHKRCQQDDNRGLPSIQQGFSPSVNLGLIKAESSSTTHAMRRLKYDHESADENSAADPEDELESLSLKAEDDSDSPNESEDEETNQQEHDLTKEQAAIIHFQPNQGDVVCVNALAGCGKTTTIAMICDRFHECFDILYLVFNKKNQDEASNSGKFPKNTEIRTTHAYVLRHYFGKYNMNNVTSIDSHDLDDIIEATDLPSEVKSMFPHLEGKIFKRRIEAIARLIRLSINKFEASADQEIIEAHVPWRATNNLTARTQWRSKISRQRYVSWSRTYFCLIQGRCHQVKNSSGKKEKIPHDSYMKVAQLEAFSTTDHTMIMIDECQDMNPCQAELFWGEHVRRGRVTYLFGDRHQQLYRFRGASNSFRDMGTSHDTKLFSLTGSFRFGENIAKAASLVLKMVKGGNLIGRSLDPGEIHDSSDSFDYGTVLCRSNNGILKYLFFEAPKKWCYLDERCKPLTKIPKWVYELEGCMTVIESSNDVELIEVIGFFYKGERFDSAREVREFGEDEGDVELTRYLDLLMFLKQQGTSLEGFRKKILKSFVPHGGCIADYDGTIMATVHKSKGLEFDRVLLYDDFILAVMSVEDIAKERCEDEINALYVAITRSKKHVYLGPKIQSFMNRLAAKFTDSPSISVVKTISQQDLRENWGDKWRIFTQDHRSIYSVEDIPWPASSDEHHDMSLLLDRKMTEMEQRQHLRKLVLRYHPDKFMPKFAGRIKGEILKESVKGRLEELYRKSWDALRALGNRGED